MSTLVPPSLPRAFARLPRRLRIALTTKPLAYWSATGLVAALTALGAHAVLADATTTRARFGVLRQALDHCLEGRELRTRTVARAMTRRGLQS